MPKPKRVLCLMDMAGVGRCSLAVVLPVLAACGVQGCPLPTALYSTHTGGFGVVAQRDNSAWGNKALAHYVQANLDFDAVYVGYLAGEGQFRLAARVLETYSHAFKVVDPALGDNGKTYSGISGGAIQKMRGLCNSANLITPNYTEIALLAGANPAEQLNNSEETARRIRQLAANRSVLATSVPAAKGEMCIAGCMEGGNYFTLPVQLVPQSYPGTGDLFTAAVVGLVLGGATLQQAAAKAASFVEAAARATFEGGGEPRHGVWFEHALPLLGS